MKASTELEFKELLLHPNAIFVLTIDEYGRMGIGDMSSTFIGIGGEILTHLKEHFDFEGYNEDKLEEEGVPLTHEMFLQGLEECNGDDSYISLFKATGFSIPLN